MYRVTFYPNPENWMVDFKWFKTAEEAFQFAEGRSEDILEIKKYGPKTHNFQNKPNCPRDGC